MKSFEELYGYKKMITQQIPGFEGAYHGQLFDESRTIFQLLEKDQLAPNAFYRVHDNYLTGSTYIVTDYDMNLYEFCMDDIFYDYERIISEYIDSGLSVIDSFTLFSLNYC